MADRPIPRLANHGDLVRLQQELEQYVESAIGEVVERLTVIERALAGTIEDVDAIISMFGATVEDETTPEDPDEAEEEFNTFDAAEEEQDIDDEEAARREAEALRRAAEAANEGEV